MARSVHRLNTLTAPKLTAGMHHDGLGLYLKVTATGSRSWLFRFTQDGRTRYMGLGAFPAVSLANARQAAAEARRITAEGRDPIEARESASRARRAPPKPSFGQIADQVLAARESTWRNPKSRAAWRLTLLEYAKPLHALPVDQVSTEAVLGILQPLWTRRPETASRQRQRQRIEIVIDYAAAKGLVPRDRVNPARWQHHLSRLLKKRQPQKHHAALPYARLPAFFAKLAEHDAPASLCLRFIILTATRSNEARGARWDEIEGDVWTVPAERTKTGKPHRVPLGEPALQILERMSEFRTSEILVFEGQRRGKPLSDMAFKALFDRMGAEKEFGALTTHGFRSTLRDWIREQTEFPAELGELTLAHSVGSLIMRAYARGDALDKRRELMAVWGRFVESESQKSY